MTTRKAMEEFLEKCEEVIGYADEQYQTFSKQEHANDNEFTAALQQMELIHHELSAIHNSANDQQREDLRRMRMRLEEMQHNMITHRPMGEM